MKSLRTILRKLIPSKSKTITLYACGVDWQHEIGEASDLEGSMPLYNSIESLKKKRSCWDSCGIVSLSLTLNKWEVSQDIAKKFK